ncbi:hypothetical protein CYLTODRAFT_132470 [Cylindrobasidium torrendii FP15055 ss-10]|uniref:Uncharacterized protein n=1 Tax=Cylindrobasidium torrendii FP15055 ss-10 TaxID=1314674 RepID=A0A0D7AYY0_9AGAR|nr:hypothetical protein CYLTODRAFT_132470 [Cylindrobasidium torrendii FP15055 ss-10]
MSDGSSGRNDRTLARLYSTNPQGGASALQIRSQLVDLRKAVDGSASAQQGCWSASRSAHSKESKKSIGHKLITARGCAYKPFMYGCAILSSGATARSSSKIYGNLFLSGLLPGLHRPRVLSIQILQVRLGWCVLSVRVFPCSLSSGGRPCF